uniref:Uncharacterized protein n=1 Tax=Ditylenchus dipsaci TaxID=166011 RepID=A0A915DDS9_9BILA
MTHQVYYRKCDKDAYSACRQQDSSLGAYQNLRVARHTLLCFDHGNTTEQDLRKSQESLQPHIRTLMKILRSSSC